MPRWPSLPLAVGAGHARRLELGAGLLVRLAVFGSLPAPTLQKEGIHAVKPAMVRGVPGALIGASLTIGFGHLHQRVEIGSLRHDGWLPRGLAIESPVTGLLGAERRLLDRVSLVSRGAARRPSPGVRHRVGSQGSVSEQSTHDEKAKESLPAESFHLLRLLRAAGVTVPESPAGRKKQGEKGQT